MKKTFKAFTLVELLIVIVIIGILMSALLPRLQGAQAMARDTSRQAQLQQLSTAIIAYRNSHGSWPKLNNGSGYGNTNNFDVLIKDGVLTQLVHDPLTENAFTGKVGTKNSQNVSTGGFYYAVINRNGVKDAGFVLAAKVETPAKANYVGSADATVDFTGDVREVAICDSVGIWNSSITTMTTKTGNVASCTARNEEQLFYIIKY